MVVSAAGQTGEVPSFADRLGERLVVAQPSGALLEFLIFHSHLSSAPFFESSLKSRLKRLSNFRHAAYARATRLQRDPLRDNRLALVSAYTPGRRLADIMTLARRGRVKPRIDAVLSLTKQLMTGTALLHDYAPDVFHGALGPERLVVGSDGRLVITEYVLGTAVEQAVTEWGAPRLWRDFRLAALSDTSLSRFGRRLDLVQIGLVTLSLLSSRPLHDNDFPGRVPNLLDAARETTADGETVPVGVALREWLGKLLCIDPDSAFRTLIEAQKAFGRMVEEEPGYGVSSAAVETFFRQCEEAGSLPLVPPEPESGESARHETAVSAAPVEPPLALPAPPVPLAAPPPVADGPNGPNDAAVVAAAAAAADTVTPAAPLAASSAAIDPAAVPAPASASAAEQENIAELLAALPSASAATSAVDPFEPWPVSVGTESVATLFDTFKPAVAPRETPGDALPVQDPQAEDPSPTPAGAPAEAPLEVVSNAWRPGRETRSPEPVGPPAAHPAAAAPASPAGGTPAHAWAEPVAPATAPSKAAVVGVEAGAPSSGGVARSPLQESSGERRAAVLSYDQVHRTSKRRRSKAPFIWIAAIVALAAAGVVGGPKIGKLLKGSATPADAARTVPAGSTEPGGFKITTQPAGSRITIDGTPRGNAPILVDGLAPGLHSVVVESDWGKAEEAVTVEAGKVTPLALATVGWIKVDAPIELQVSEEGRNYGATKGSLMVPAGRHAFVFVNESVAVRHRQFVQVPAGQVVRVTLELPQGVLNLTSDQPAQVLLDGEPIGETPQVSVPASLGPHEVVFRSPKYGDVSYSVNVTLAAPVSLRVAFGSRR
jgi:hypothetical protein